jgi:hypothetical protein
VFLQIQLDRILPEAIPIGMEWKENQAVFFQPGITVQDCLIG